ncbi:MAG: pilus assembly protein PilN [SAR86 cluster bacterium]|uniref:Pilus assembly protein PilN n=1 Tax=SAR86 cluster bacterium TaxID=2030880 RepID=A0A2A5B2X1_9GAMM|nr:MAG: pilus assembly protein PilN [SAR86 cluster bacterium]
MAHINLLPWRERLREERKREFLTILVGVVIISGGILFLVHTFFTGEINTQMARNDFVRTEIAVLDERVVEITELRQQKEDIRARMNVISDLQGTRPVIVRIFDELVKTLPDGVFYSSLNRVDNTVSIEGVAESYERITELLRRLDESDWFQESDLDEISAVPSGEDSILEAFTFTLSLSLQLQDQQEEV